MRGLLRVTDGRDDGEMKARDVGGDGGDEGFFI